jgi:hypothetical protein
MSSLPTRTDISGTPSNATAKAALSALYDFVAQRWARGTSGAGTATAAELASARDSLGVPMANVLDNPDGAVYQRSVTATADDAYCFDRWYALTQTSTITPSQVNNPEDGYRFAMRLTQSQAIAQRMGLAQIVESKDAVPLRGKTMTFGGRVKMSTTATLRIAVLAWTGSEDAVTSDVVSNWTSTTFTTGNFFASTSLSLVGASSATLTAATAADISVSGTVPSGATNLIVFYWTDAAAAQNVTLDAWGMRLIESSYLNEHVRRSYGEELARCQRFFEKSYGSSALTVAAAHQAVASTGSMLTSGSVRFAVTKRTAPTIVYYSPIDAATGVMGEYNTSAVAVTNRTATLVGALDTGFSSVTASATVGNQLLFHWTASADL